MKTRPRSFLLIAAMLGCVLSATAQAAIPVKCSREEIEGGSREHKEAIKAEPVDPDYLPTARKIVDTALAKYPEEILAKCVPAIYLTKALQIDGEPMAAFAPVEAIWIDVSADNGDLALRVHALLARAFLKSHRDCLPREWMRTLPDRFSYPKEVPLAPIETSIEPRLLADGFISSYSQSSVVGDFALMSAWMFLGDDLFVEETEGNVKLMMKRRLVRKFYLCVDRSFEQYVPRIPGVVGVMIEFPLDK
jgi:hypothetical protein